MSENTEKWYQKISVEPSVTLYMLAFMIITVFEQAFFINKACRVNHNLTEEICANLQKKEYENYNHQVQVTVSNFLQWDSMATNVIPMILALFSGAWSDKHGRKLPLIIGLCGKLYYSIMIVVNSVQPWPLQYIIYTATLPMAFSGADVLIFSSAYSYLSDVTNNANRTFRITIFHAAYFSAMPIGIALGRILFNDLVNKSYTFLFIINATVMLVSIVYSIFVLKWQTTSKQTPLRESEVNFIVDFFDRKHLLKVVSCLKQRKEQISLIPFIFITIFNRFPREEKSYLYLFFTNKMDWDYNDFSNFKTVQTTFMVVMMVFGIRFMIRILKYPDTVIILIGCLSQILSRVMFMIVQVDWMFYLATLIGSLSLIVAPTFRSMVSKSTSSTERGSVFSILSIAENSVPLYSGILFSQLYNYTVNVFPPAFFLITIITQLLLFIIVLYIYFKFPDDNLIYKEQEKFAEISNDSPEKEIFIKSEETAEKV